MKTLKAAIGICILVLAPVSCLAQGSGTTVVEFLNIGVSAKSSATGGALSAIADGPVSSFYNPAGLSSIENYQVAGMHTEWYQDLRYEYLGYGMPIGRSGGLGLSFSYLTYGSIEAYSETGALQGNIDAYDMALNLSYGHRIYKDLSMGIGIKGISEKLDDVNATGFAGDFGLQYRRHNYMLGLSVMNLGPKLKYENSSSPLPTTVNAGVLYKPFGPGLSVIMGGSIPFKGEFSLKTGLEYSYNDVFMIRTGYDAGQNFGDDGGFSFGAGVNVSNHNLDYAYNIDDVMGGTHQISFVFKFGRSRSEIQVEKPTYSRSPEIRPQEIYTVTQYDISEVSPQPQPEIEPAIDTSVQKTYTEALEKKTVNKEKIYQICAARYHNRESAQKHIETLKKFGIDSRIYYDGVKEYRVVLEKTDKLSKAQKLKSDFDKKGIFCFIEEL